MGLIIAKFRRAKSNSVLIDRIQQDIDAIERFQTHTEHQRKRIIGQFLVFSVGVYLLSATLIYFYFYPNNFRERLLYLVPFTLAPSFIFFMKKLLTWYYNRKSRKNATKLVKLQEDKKKILETIMDTETYKVARDILEKYAPEQIQKTQIFTPAKGLMPVTPLMQGTVRNRLAPNRSLMANPKYSPNNSSFRGLPDAQSVSRQGALSTPRTPLPHGILPKDRTVFDKMIEYLLGDGPNHRYALICKQCSGHNGMALINEFEYISFKCCYCGSLNPSRKKRPIAPKIPLKDDPFMAESAESSDSEKLSENEVEGETKKNENDSTQVETLNTTSANKPDIADLPSEGAEVSNEGTTNDGSTKPADT